MTSTDTPKEDNPASGQAQGTPVEIEVLISGIAFGPFNESKTRERLAEGLVALNDKARLVGSADWKTLQEVLDQLVPPPPTQKFEPVAEGAPEITLSETKIASTPATGRTVIIPPRAPTSGSLSLDARAKSLLRPGTAPSTPTRTGAQTGPMPLIPPPSSDAKPGGIRSQILARTSQEPLKMPAPTGTPRHSIRATTGPLSFAAPTPSKSSPAAPPVSGFTFPPRFPTARPKLEEEAKPAETPTLPTPLEESAQTTPLPPEPAPEPEPLKPVTESGPISPATRSISVAAFASGALPRPPAAVTPSPSREEEAGSDPAGEVRLPKRRRTQVIKALPGAAVKTGAMQGVEPDGPSFRPQVPSAHEKSITAPLPAPGRPGRSLAESSPSSAPTPTERAVRRGMANASALAATTPLAAFTKGGPPPLEQEGEEEPPAEMPPELDEFEPLENFERDPEAESERPSIPLVETRRAALREARLRRKQQNLLLGVGGLVFLLLICAGIYHYTMGGHEKAKPAPAAPPPATTPPPATQKSSTGIVPAENKKIAALPAATPPAAPAAASPSPTATPAVASPSPTAAPAAASPSPAVASSVAPAATPSLPAVANAQPPEDPKVLAHVAQGQAIQAKGDYDGAIAEFTQAILLDPKYAPAFGYRAAVRQAKGDLEGAIADDDQLLTLEPHNANGFSQRGFLKQANKDLDGALADYSRALELDPKSVIAFYNRGMIQEQKGRPDAAIADYNQALVLNPKLPGAYYNRGNAKMDKSDLDGAIADYTSALEINPKIALAACNRALAEQNGGNLDAAIADYTRALSLDPKIAMAYYNRGLIKEQKDDLDGCVADSTKAIELDPNNAQAYYNRGVALQAKGNLDAAANDLHKFGELAPRNVYADYAHLYLWVINNERSRKLEADQELSNSLDSSWNAEPAQLASKIANFLLDHISESELMAVASSPDPKKDRGQHCEAWYFDGIKKMLTGNKSAAIDCFHHCLNTGQKDFCEYILAEAQLQTISPS